MHHFQIYPWAYCRVRSLPVGGEMGVNTGRRDGAREGIWDLFTVEDLFPPCFQNVSTPS